MINILNELSLVSWPILREIAFSSGGLSASEISKRINHSQSTCFRELNSLEALKIVFPNYVGNSKIYNLEKNYYVNKIILPALRSEKKYFSSLKQEIIKCISLNAKAIVIFGSYASYSHTWQSDMDLCVIVAKKTKKLEDDIFTDLSAIGDSFALSIEPYIITETEFSKKNNSDVLNDIKNKGQFIFGDRMTFLSFGKNI